MTSLSIANGTVRISGDLWRVLNVLENENENEKGEPLHRASGVRVKDGKTGWWYITDEDLAKHLGRGE